MFMMCASLTALVIFFFAIVQLLAPLVAAELYYYIILFYPLYYTFFHYFLSLKISSALCSLLADWQTQIQLEVAFVTNALGDTAK